MENQLKKAIELSRKTGDRLIIYDSSRNNQPFVVMSLDEYEKMVVDRSEVRGLTEQGLIDKINRDIAIWKSEKRAASMRLDDPFAGHANRGSFTPVSGVLSDDYGFSGEDFEDYDEDDEDMDDFEAFPEDKWDDRGPEAEATEKEPLKRKGQWRIPAERKAAAEEVVEDEDRQYLEPVSF